MKFNKEKHIGRVLFIVEGSHYEFSLIRKIFYNLLGYSYIEKRRNKLPCFINGNDKYSQVAIINTRESNIRDISENESFLDDVFDVLREKYQFPIDQCAIYYLFDRDPKSNTNVEMIKKYISLLANPYDNGDYKAGQLLLSYPSVESFTISNFRNKTNLLRFNLGSDAKSYINENPDIQLNKITQNTLLNAAFEFLEYLKNEQIILDIDNFSQASCLIFTKQEIEYLSNRGFKVFSMLTLAFLQMGIIEIT